jgi:hypothetical protein
MPNSKPNSKTIAKPDKLQEIRNRVPKVIVELIITFVPLTNFQTMTSIMEGFYPFHKTVFNRGNFKGLPWYIETFLINFQITGRDIQSPMVIEHQLSFDAYALTIQGIEKIIALLKENLHSKRKVFYTWKLEEKCHSHIAYWGKRICCLIERFYIMKHEVTDSNGHSKRYFFMEETKTEHRAVFNLTITASGKEDKKEAINFFKGFGQFVDWMRTTVPIKDPF